MYMYIEFRCMYTCALDGGTNAYHRAPYCIGVWILKPLVIALIQLQTVTRLWGTAAAALSGVLQGANIVWYHSTPFNWFALKMRFVFAYTMRFGYVKWNILLIFQTLVNGSWSCWNGNLKTYKVQFYQRTITLSISSIRTCTRASQVGVIYIVPVLCVRFASGQV